MAPTKPYFGFTGGWLTFWVSLACATDMTLLGYDQGVFSGVVVTPDFLQVHGLVKPSKTKILSTVTAIYDIGCFFGAILAFTAGERLGRKNTILLGCTIMAIGTVVKASSYRKLVILELGLNVGGYCLVNWINYGLSFKEGSIAWRLPIALQHFFSPRWLLSHGRDDEALENAMPWRDLLRNKSDKTETLRRLLNQHNELLPAHRSDHLRGPDRLYARLLTACDATSYFISSCIAVTMIERFGRRGLMLLSGSGQFVSFLVITILLHFAETDIDTDKAYCSASVASFLYHVAFGSGMLGLEGKVTTLTCERITNFAVVEITPIGIQNIGWLFLPVMYFLYPETANRTLEDIDSYFRSNPPLLVTRDPDAISAKRPLKYVQREDEEIQRRMKEARIMGRKSDGASVEHVN
ncbi:hypothetical protein BDW60DRAFT_226402 [Aspergillus nidulans var. acristatus]